MSILTIPWPYRKPEHEPIVPVFLPFAGCRTRCIYCAQNVQTGQGALTSPAAVLGGADGMLRLRRERGLAPCELAFFGGTFTGQPEGDFSLCVSRARRWLDEGIITAWRCSTRPDCLSPGLLRRMAAGGCRTVELGIQSFDARVLRLAGRGYGPDVPVQAMRLVNEAGLRLGAQLLPGLPDATPEIFLRDVDTAIALGAAFFRFYPCLVIRGTALAALYSRGQYRSWDMETPVGALAEGTALAGRAGLPVIRMGVASEPSLLENLLAGPFDEALGTRVMSRLLLQTLQRTVPAGCRIAGAALPRFTQGYVFGQNGSSAPTLRALGLTGRNAVWTDRDIIELTLAPCASAGEAQTERI